MIPWRGGQSIGQNILHVGGFPQRRLGGIVGGTSHSGPFSNGSDLLGSFKNRTIADEAEAPARADMLMVSVTAVWPNEHQKILGDYLDVVLLKQGGQKAAYRGRHPAYGQVVVKIGTYASLNGLKRIQREVEVLRGLSSVYYPRNIAFTTNPPNYFVIVEEYVPSTPLSYCLDQFLKPKDSLGFLKHLVTGLSVIWDKRVVHRDVKPDNILVLADATPKIIDLGIARLLDDESLTRTINAREPCTPNYAAPEQLKNRKAQIDQRADQFGLGIVFVQLALGGDHPFDPSVVGGGDSIGRQYLG